VNHIELPTTSGAYRWYYVDVSAGEFTAVFIFMVGSIFSARYSMALKKGGLPREHAAVNFALYEKGVRTMWVLTEYGAVKSPDSQTLQIGNSELKYGANTLTAVIRDKTTPFLMTQWGEPTHVELELTPEGPSYDEVVLVPGLSHRWRPIAARSRATVRVKSHELEFTGHAYHDGNYGQVPLGSDLPGWDWARTHSPDATTIAYRPWADAPSHHVRVDTKTATAAVSTADAAPTVRSTWGLRVPSTLGVTGLPTLIESSPFYARLEAREGSHHALGEVADFARFHSRSVRWMANFRTRTGDST
jgi:carotenoid 1,2-hydratase